MGCEMRDEDDSFEEAFDGTPSGIRERVEDLFRSAVRKTVSQGVGAALHTEDLIRQRVTDLRLPKEVATYLITTIDHTRRELVRMSANEVRAFLERANLAEEVARILTTLSLDIRIQMKFVPNDQAIRPNVTSQVRVRHGEEDADEQEDENLESLEEGTADAVLDAAVREVGQEVLHRVWRGLAAFSAPATGAPEDAAPAAKRDVSTPVKTSGESAAQKTRASGEGEPSPAKASRDVAVEAPEEKREQQPPPTATKARAAPRSAPRSKPAARASTSKKAPSSGSGRSTRKGNTEKD